MIQLASVDSTLAYRREARRLRCRYANRPAELYNSLRQLSAQQDRQQGIDPSLHNDERIPLSTVQMPGGSRQFAKMVAAKVERGVLRFSARQRLLSIAEQMGIHRFEANLVIAAVQHQLGTTASAHQPPQERWASRLLAFVLLQGLIVTSIYLVFLSH